MSTKTCTWCWLPAKYLFMAANIVKYICTVWYQAERKSKMRGERWGWECCSTLWLPPVTCPIVPCSYLLYRNTFSRGDRFLRHATPAGLLTTTDKVCWWCYWFLLCVGGLLSVDGGLLDPINYIVLHTCIKSSVILFFRLHTDSHKQQATIIQHEESGAIVSR